MASTLAIGRHRMTIDGDWVELRLTGPVGIADSTPMHDTLAAVLDANEGRAYVLADITDLESLHHETRRQMAAWNRDRRISAAAVFGGSFAVRTIVTLALKALKLRDREQIEAMFARDEAEARRWLQAERSRRGQAGWRAGG